MKKLIKKRAALKAQLQTMLDKAKTEERAFSDDETKEFDRIEGEIKSIDATIEAEERANGIEDFHVPMATPDESKEKLEEALPLHCWKVLQCRFHQQKCQLFWKVCGALFQR